MSSKSINLCFIGNMLGHDPKYSNTQGEILAKLFAAEGYPVVSVSPKINRTARLIDIFFTLLKKRKKIDVVFLDVFSGLYFVTADMVGLLCRLFDIPLIMVLRGGSLPEYIEKYPKWSKRILDRADYLIAPSDFLAEEVSAAGYRVKVIPNVINLDGYAYGERSAVAPRLIWMRSFHPIYNPEMAVRVLARLREDFPRAELTMAGADKGLEDEIKGLVTELDLTDAVRFPGFLDLNAKIREFSAADIYLNTNRVDNMPVSVVEARALGLPVVATEVGGLSYLIEDGENGFLVPDNDVDAMVARIKKLLAEPETARKISRNGRVIAERSAWQNVREQWEKLISEVLRRKNTSEKKALAFGGGVEAE